jgi:uncharacterized protein (DUF4213/DUF364 family)
MINISKMILNETYDLIKTRYPGLPGNLKISDVRIGVFLTAVILSDGSCGVAGSIGDGHPVCTKQNRDFGDFTPGMIKGKSVEDLFESFKNSNLINALKIAVLNAVSSRLLTTSGYKIVENSDPLDLVKIKPGQSITMVGAFQSYMQKIAETGAVLRVLELNEDAFNADNRKYFVPADQYQKILPLSDILIITGLTLVNDTIDNLLNCMKPGSHVIVTGPSASLLPDVLFHKGVSSIGATRITDPVKLLEVVSEGGAGYHLFKYCAQKICILNEN